MKRLLIITFAQFGYHTDTLYYARLLKDRWEVHYLCWDYGRPKVSEAGVAVHYISRNGSFPARIVRFLGVAIRMCRSTFDLVLVVYFHLCSLLRFFAPGVPIILDIRTGYVMRGEIRRLLFNVAIRVESSAFPHISIITEELRKVLGIPGRKVHILPLGAERRLCRPRDFRELRLLYVGTLTNRGIGKTVEGYGIFLRSHRGGGRCTYDIVGSGLPAYEAKIRAAVAGLPASHGLVLHGRIPHSELGPYLQAATVGVAFVPITRSQDPQPYTKVYEYLLSGLPVIATANATNKRLISPERGILVEDAAESFAEGLSRIVARLGEFDSDRIVAGMADSTWEAIVDKNLHPYLEGILRASATGRAAEDAEAARG